ncbi:MAG: hypothetical protein NT116_03805 [Candidatus Parcubacteria bacterium]|nr:hypothetical protein [Candidatus Parcubacteria bacterium]
MGNLAEAFKRENLLTPEALKNLQIKEDQKIINAKKQQTDPKKFNKNGIPLLKEDDDEFFRK